MIFCSWLGLLLAGCNRPEEAPPSKVVKPIYMQHELVVLTQNGPNTFYIDADGNYAGFEYDLVNLFAQRLGVPVRFVLESNRERLYRDLAGREGHLAAAGLIASADRKAAIDYGPVYLSVTPVVAYNTDMERPGKVEDLVGHSILVPAGSAYIRQLMQHQQKTPQLSWREEPYFDIPELVEKIANGEADYLVADSNVVELLRNYYPNIGIAFPLGGATGVAWAFPKQGAGLLKEEVRRFFADIAKDGTLARLQDRYFGHIKRLNPIDVQTMLERRVTELPKYRKYLEESEGLTGIDWRLLAALGYQESHWDPLATSAYGVRGIMMLTTSTADRLGIKNRLDPRQSILGGARYLQMLREMLPARISEPDRSWLALAVYNIGYAHLEDARVLAQRLKKNPDSWADLKAVLPLLRDEQYFTTLKYGYARGGETVAFVENVRTYRDILARFESPLRPLFPAFNEQVTVTNPDNLKLGIGAARVKPAEAAPANR